MESGGRRELAARTVDGLLIFTLGATAFLLPLFVHATAREPFREPKAILFRIAALSIATLLAWQWALGRAFRIARRPAVVIVLILLWTLITTLTSTNLILSRAALGHAAAAAVLFVAAWMNGQRGGRLVVLATVAAGVFVASVAILQATALWSPLEFEPALGTRVTVTSFLGNPNDVGGWLVVPAVLSLGGAFHLSGWRRWAAMGAFGLFAAGILASVSATALLSLALSGAWLIARSAERRRVGTAVIAFLLLAVIGWAAARQSRFVAKWEAAESSVGDLLSGRLLSWTTAAMMIRDSPLAGVGPGAYGWNYLNYQAAAQREFERFEADRYRSGAFEEVHSDYLEIAAETGVIGLLLAGAAFWAFLRPGALRTSSPESRFALIIGPPLLLSLAVQMATNFPLQLSAVLGSYLLVGGTVFSWRLD